MSEESNSQVVTVEEVPVVEPVPEPVELIVESVPEPVTEEPLAVVETCPVLEEAPAPILEEVTSSIIPVVEEVVSAIEEVAAVVEEIAADIVPEPVVIEDQALPPVASDEKIDVVTQVEEVPAASTVIEVVVTPEPAISDISGTVTPSLINLLQEEGITTTAEPASSISEEAKKVAPQKYADLGKEARDLFSKNFHLDTVQSKATTKSTEGCQFATEGKHDVTTGNTIANLETKFKYEPYGLSFTKKWDTNNLISSKIGLDSNLLKGFTLDLDTTFVPSSGKKTALVKSSYQHGDLLHATADVDFGELSAPVINASAVAAYKGLHAGYHFSYDTASSCLVNSNFSLAYKTNDISMLCSRQNGTDYVGSIHHQVNEKLCTAVIGQYTSGGSAPSFGLCGSYVVDDSAAVKAKLDNNLCLGLSYVQKLQPGLELTMSGLVNGKSLEKGGHKIGLSLSFEA